MSDERTPTSTEETAGSASEADGDSDSDSDSESEPETTVDIDVEDDEDQDDRPSGSAEDTTPPPGEDDSEEGNGDQTVPSVELDLYDLSVRVSGQSTDDLDAVDEAARGLMNYLVDQAQRLEDRPDDRGLS